MPLEQADIDRLTEIFVPRRECDGDMKHVDDKLSKDNARLAVIEQQLKTITWLITAICGGVIAMIIKLFFGG